MQLQLRSNLSAARNRPSPRSRAVVIPKASPYVAPSQASSATELQLLRNVSTVQIDSIAADNLLPTSGAAVSFGLLLRAVRSEALGLRPLEVQILIRRLHLFNIKYNPLVFKRILSTMAISCLYLYC